MFWFRLFEIFMKSLFYVDCLERIRKKIDYTLMRRKLSKIVNTITNPHNILCKMLPHNCKGNNRKYHNKRLNIKVRIPCANPCQDSHSEIDFLKAKNN